MRFISTALLILSVAACGGSDSTAPVDPRVAASGVYDLQTVNSSPLPAVLATGATSRIELTRGIETLRSDGSYTETLTVRITDSYSSSSQDVVENGTFTIVGSQITFTDSDKFSYTGAVANGQLTYTTDGLSVQYRRR